MFFKRSHGLQNILFGLLFVQSNYALTINQIFNVKAGTVNGGCDSYDTMLSQYLTEITDLTATALNAISSLETTPDVVTEQLLTGYFGLDFANGNRPDTSTVLAWYQGVNAYINTASTAVWLFCDSTWLQLYQWTDQAFEVDGTLQTDAQGKPVLIYENYVQYFADPALQPYWSSDLVDYVFDKRYTNTRKTYCGLTATAGNFGATQMQASTSVTLCPSSFSSNQFVNTLGNGDTAPTVGASIKTVLPKSATLFHELFHVTQGNAESPDASYDLSKLQALAQNAASGTVPNGVFNDNNYPTNGEITQHNPETYVFFAVAAWYAAQTYTDSSGNKFTYNFASGVAVENAA